MSTLRALILDDEPPAQRYLAELLRATGIVNPVAIVASTSEAQLAIAQPIGIDVAFVDVNLNDRSGDTSELDWARSLLQQPNPPQLVLATAAQEHAITAFEAGAVDDLLKPITRQRVALCVERLHTRSLTRPSSLPPVRLMARTASSLVFLPFEGILAFEAENRLTFVHHVEGRYLADLSLNAFEQQLPQNMIRTHRNWLVALDQVRKLSRVDSELVLVINETLTIPISRDRSASVRDALVSRSLGTRL
jgi:DNA-binding LytR/AlgR family response regulator